MDEDELIDILQTPTEAFSETESSSLNMEAEDIGIPKNIVDLYNRRQDILTTYQAMAENEQDFYQEQSRTMLIPKLQYALRKAGDWYSEAMRQHRDSKADRKRIVAIAKLDFFGEWLVKKKQSEKEEGKEKTAKSTDAFRDDFASQHTDVLKAHKRENYFESMAKSLELKHGEIADSLSTIRKMCYGFNDGNRLNFNASTEVVDQHGDGNCNGQQD